MIQNRIYQLQKNVSFKKESHACFLVSTFPLRAVKLDIFWAPFFQHLESHGNRGAKPRSQDIPKGMSFHHLHRFLQQLVQKGFIRERIETKKSSIPRVSIIIPVRNRPRDLDRCLNSLAKMNYPQKQVEVIVVDDGSDDGTPGIAKKYQTNLFCNHRQQGASFSRNRGAEKATGDILCFLDSDCTVDHQWLCRLISLFDDPDITACGGAVDAQLDRTRLDRYEKACSSLHMGDHACDSRNGNAFFYVPSCNFAARKESFLAVGGFKTKMTVGEDVDLCWRLIDRGGVVAYTPHAVVFHRHRNQISTFALRRYQYGTSEPMLQSIHANRKKTFPVYTMATLFWLLVIVAAQLFLPLGLCAISLFLGEAILFHHKTHEVGLPMNPFSILYARARHYLSVLYHLAAFCSRYYLMVALLIHAMYSNPITMGMILGHFFVGLVKYWVKKPELDLFSFLLFFSMEQLSYQSGVWAACFKHRFFKPVAPQIIVKAVGLHH